MKTKIIYISGNEVFDMHDIRDAFNQVRAALQLGDDTVLFGVPVDKSDALQDVTDSNATVTAAQPAEIQAIPEPVIETPEPIITDETTAPIDTISTVEHDTITEPVVDVVAPKKSRGRQKSVKKSEQEQITDTVPETDNTVSTTESDTTIENTDKVVSILSVLTAKQDTVAPAEETIIAEQNINPVTDTVSNVTTEIDTGIDISADLITDTETIVSTVVADVTPVDETDDVIIDDMAQPVSVEDMITDEEPVVSQEKTLEQLLESMTPLREDLEHEQYINTVEDSAENIPVTDEVVDSTTISTDDDATLEQLATEFAENQDQITTNQKPGNNGKIGKLKNILPFKKARRDDSGLMGDLFGWAGIAANDEDFAIPGFFTNAASKK